MGQGKGDVGAAALRAMPNISGFAPLLENIEQGTARSTFRPERDRLSQQAADLNRGLNFSFKFPKLVNCGKRRGMEQMLYLGLAARPILLGPDGYS